jgi:hypothetical protein
LLSNRGPRQGRRSGIVARPGPRRMPGMTLLGSDREGQPRALRISDVNALAVVNVDHRHPVAVEVGSVQRAVIDCQPTALVEPQDQMRARDPRIGNAHIGLHVASDDHLVAGREGSLGPVMPNCQDGRGGSSHHSSIGPCWQCALLDPAVTSLCFDPATHSPFIACCDESPTAVRHYSIGRGSWIVSVRAEHSVVAADARRSNGPNRYAHAHGVRSASQCGDTRAVPGNEGARH